FRRNDDVAHSGRLNQLYPGGGIELIGMKLRCNLILIGRQRNAVDSHNMLSVARIGISLPHASQDRVGAPVDETSEARVTPPVKTRVAGLERMRVPAGLGVANRVGVSLSC